METRPAFLDDPSPKERKIIQISSYINPLAGTATIVALCDDGTLWTRRDTSKQWYKLESIPQDS